MRRARRTDANQKAIVAALRAAGVSVAVISDVGRGVPDLLCGLRMRNFLLEVKVPGAELTTMEADWHAGWRGLVHVVRTPEEAIRAVTGCASPTSG